MGDLILGGGTVIVDNPSTVVEITQPGHVQGIHLMVGPPGPPGSGSAGSLVRSDTTAFVAYLGTAPASTADGDPGWTITRLDLHDMTTTTATGAWVDRATLTYT